MKNSANTVVLPTSERAQLSGFAGRNAPTQTGTRHIASNVERRGMSAARAILARPVSVNGPSIGLTQKSTAPSRLPTKRLSAVGCAAWPSVCGVGRESVLHQERALRWASSTQSATSGRTIVFAARKNYRVRNSLPTTSCQSLEVEHTIHPTFSRFARAAIHESMPAQSITALPFGGAALLTTEVLA